MRSFILALLLLPLPATANLYQPGSDAYAMANVADDVLPRYMKAMFFSRGFDHDLNEFLDEKSLESLGISRDEVKGLETAPGKVPVGSPAAYTGLHVLKNTGKISQICPIYFVRNFAGKRGNLFRMVLLHELMHCRTMDYAQVKNYKAEFSKIISTQLVKANGEAISNSEKHYLMLEIMADTMAVVYIEKTIKDPAFLNFYRRSNPALSNHYHHVIDYVIEKCGAGGSECTINTGLLMKSLLSDPGYIAMAHKSIESYASSKVLAFK